MREPSVYVAVGRNRRAVMPREWFRRALTDQAPRFPSPADGEQFPIITRLVDECVRKMFATGNIALPRIDSTESISIASDFGGEHKGATHRTFSFLCSAYRPLDFVARMQAIRQKHGLTIPAREIAFKDLRGGVARALPEYLFALDSLVPGLLLTIAVPVGHRWLLVGDAQEASMIYDDAAAIGLPRRKLRVMQKTLWVIHVCAYLLALLGRAGQKALWLVDNDEIVPNGDGAAAAANLLGAVLGAYAKAGPRLLGFALPFADRSDMAFHDMLSATDIAAGYVADVLARDQQANAGSKRGIEAIGDWLGTQGLALRKMTIRIDPPGARGEFRASVLRLP